MKRWARRLSLALAAILLASLGSFCYVRYVRPARERARFSGKLYALLAAGKYEEWVSTYRESVDRGPFDSTVLHGMPFTDVLTVLTRGGCPPPGPQREALAEAARIAVDKEKDDSASCVLLLVLLELSNENPYKYLPEAIKAGTDSITITHASHSPLEPTAAHYAMKAVSGAVDVALEDADPWVRVRRCYDLSQQLSQLEKAFEAAGSADNAEEVRRLKGALDDLADMDRLQIFAELREIHAGKRQAPSYPVYDR